MKKIMISFILGTVLASSSVFDLRHDKPVPAKPSTSQLETRTIEVLLEKIKRSILTPKLKPNYIYPLYFDNVKAYKDVV